MPNTDISGQITDSAGNPIASAKVYLWREDLVDSGGVVDTVTADSNGNFSFTGHPDGSGSSESWHVAAEDPTANVQLVSAHGVKASPPSSVNSQFDMSITDASPNPVTSGDTLSVDASLTNSGTDSDTQLITLDINDGVGQVDSSLEAAQSGGGKAVPLSWNVPSGQTAKDYQATVSSRDDSASQTVTVGPPVSLISHWTFNSADTSGSTAIDTVGTNDGTIQGATTGVSGANQTYTTNEAYSFDGTGDRVDLPSLGITTDGTAGYTLAAWVNVPSGAGISSSRYDVFARIAESHEIHFNSYSTYNASGTTQFKIWDGNNDHYVNGTDIRGDGWVHLVFTYDPSTGMELYENGVSQATDPFTGTPNATSDGNIIGGFGSRDYFEGDADDVRVYDKALTSTEVSNLYNTGFI